MSIKKVGSSPTAEIIVTVADGGQHGSSSCSRCGTTIADNESLIACINCGSTFTETKLGPSFGGSDF